MLAAHASTAAPATEVPRVFLGLRVMLIAGAPGPTRALVRALEACSARVAVVGARGSGLERAREIDPQLLLSDPWGAPDGTAGAERVLDDDPRLRWASVTRVSYRELLSMRALAQLAGTVALVVEPDLRLAAGARSRTSVTADLARIGPARALRAAEAADAPVCLTATTGAAIAEVVLSRELVVSASFWETGPATVRLDGLEALSAFLTMRRGQISIAPCVSLPAGNVLAPLGQALSQATHTVDTKVHTVCMPGAQPIDPAWAAAPVAQLDWDEDDFTTARFPAQPRFPPPPRMPAPAAPLDGPTATHAPLDRPAAAPAVHRPSSIAPISIDGRRDGPRGVPSPLWVAGAAALVLGALGAAIAMQPGGLTALGGTGDSPRSAAEGRPVPLPHGTLDAQRAVDPEPERPAGVAGDAQSEGEGDAARGEDGAAPSWLEGLPASPRRAVRELVARARAIERDDDAEAERIYTYAHELAPHAPRPMAGLAEIYLRRGDADAAAVWADRAIQASPRRASYRVLLGDALAASGDIVGARAAWTEAARIAPGRPNIRRRLAR